MDDYQSVLGFNKVELDKIQWGTAYFTIPEFLREFKFPQIVKVTVGFYGESSESTVSANQVLCLQSIKSIKKIRAHDSNGKEFSISLDCQRKVEVRPSNLKDIYDNIDELCEAFPRYVRISQGYYDASKNEEILNVGDKLRLGSVEKSKSGEKKLICINQNGQLIVLSQDCVAGFQPLFNEKEYYLAEVLKDFSLPLPVRFVESDIVDKEIQQPLGTVCLDEIFSETVITATSIRSDGKHTSVEFSSDTDICLVVCEEAFRKSANYDRICQNLKQYVDLQNNNTKNATDFKNTSKSSLETIQREVLHSNVSKSNQAEAVKPIVSLPKTKVIVPESPIPEAKSDSANTMPPKLPKTTPDPAKVIPPKPAARKAKPGAAKEISPTSYLTEVTPADTDTQSHKLKISKSTHDATTTDANLRFAQVHNKSSQHQSTVDEDGYAEPNEVFQNIEIAEQENYSECRFVKDSTYTALDPKYVSTNSHEYAKPYVEPQSILVTSAKSNKRSFLGTTNMATRPLPQVPVSSPHHKFSEPDGSPSDSLPINKMPELTPEQHEEMYQAIAKYPTDLSKLSVTEVSRLLHNLGMGNYAEMFAAEMVDGDMLSSMNAETLQSLNLSPFHATKLAKFIGGWRPNAKCTDVETPVKEAEIFQYEL